MCFKLPIFVYRIQNEIFSIMESLQFDMNKRYSYADYLTWFDNIRRELINGFIKLMSPAPSKMHQEISVALSGSFYQYLKRIPCQVFHAPFDVRLPNNDEKDEKKIYTVVQPDICVICDPEKLDDKGCLGPPDLIIEIVSDQNPKRDVKEKFELYQRHGVSEYWMIFPDERTLFVYLLNKEGKYENVGIYAEDEKVKVNIFDDFHIDLAEIFRK
jgi:Uma2 family endonuclease